MAVCDEVHRLYDGIANGPVQVGRLPDWTRVRGPVAWYVYQGSYAGLGDAWRAFMGKAQAAKVGPLQGPPGDVYVCDPDDHAGAKEETLTTIFYAPLKG